MLIFCSIELRAKFILEGLADLRKNLKKRGLDLYVEYGKPENILPRLTGLTSAHTVMPLFLHIFFIPKYWCK